jgi:hypothetical protein
MDDMSNDALRKVGELFLQLRNPILPTNSCPLCGVAMKLRDSLHCSGRDEQGRRWTGGVDWAFCEPCQRWFKQVYRPKHPPPHSWDPCEPPNLF